LLFGYFLLGKQEKVTRAPWMACEKAQGREAVFVAASKQKKRQRRWVPAFAGMTKRRERGGDAKTIPPTLPLKERRKKEAPTIYATTTSIQ
ncbi:MAG: hypothetical protein ACREPX_01035, partial [Rhodanobacteraceae bacterium]